MRRYIVLLSIGALTCAILMSLDAFAFYPRSVLRAAVAAALSAFVVLWIDKRIGPAKAPQAD